MNVTHATPTEDSALVEALQNGDESTFEQLIQKYQASMVRVAMLYVADRTIAEDVVQDTWIGMLQGLGKFEGRSSLKTWIFSILTNRAKTRAEKEGRQQGVSFDDLGGDEPAVEQERFTGTDHPFTGHWAELPDDWGGVPENRLLSAETQSVIQTAIEALPPNQRAVIRLHDIEEWTTQEICNILEISESNQRVLLHRARSKVRAALERYFRG